MTNKEAIEELKKVDTLDMPARLCEAHYMSIKALEQEPKLDRLYSWLNDMRLSIAPDERTPDYERRVRQAQVDLLDDIMEWIDRHIGGENNVK